MRDIPQASSRLTIRNCNKSRILCRDLIREQALLNRKARLNRQENQADVKMSIC